ncbi:MAG: MotA/TolQ/ExbB proton channel family protein [Proteobacteria bacterium]|nr:MotA/TolQ/ExbB proton channel family protein [Pseudomonadota bacterium]
MHAFEWVRDVMVKGGPTLWGLFLLSVVLIALIVERVQAFRKSTVDQDWLVQQMAILLTQDKVKEALDFVDGIEGSLPRVFEVGLKRYEEPREVIENAMKVAIARQSLLMEKNVSIIGTFAVICPFVGLFGTVVGIMHAFESIANKGGTGPAAVAAGVAEALICTAAGLFVAISAVVSFNYFRNRIRVTTDELLINIEVFSDMIAYVKEGRPFPQDLRELLNLPHLAEAPGEKVEPPESYPTRGGRR